MEWFSGARALQSDVGGLLESLGTTPEEVAERLDSEEVTGMRKSGSQCAVAVYLRAVVGADPRVRALRVSDREVELTRWGLLALPVRVGLPPAVRAFVAGFDRGRFPDLERPRPPNRRAVSKSTGWRGVGNILTDEAAAPDS
jgi:hypothetical protein